MSFSFSQKPSQQSLERAAKLALAKQGYNKQQDQHGAGRNNHNQHNFSLGNERGPTSRASTPRDEAWLIVSSIVHRPKEML